MNDGPTGGASWVGIDAGKESHWAHMPDASGIQLLSRKVENDEAQLAALIEEALSLAQDRKSTRLNSSHANISYAVFCLKKKNLLPILYSPLFGHLSPVPPSIV